MIEVIVLVLASITLLLVSVVVLLVLGFRKSVEIDRLKQILQGTVKKLGVPSDTCQHSFGYLNCMHACMLAMDRRKRRIF